MAEHSTAKQSDGTFWLECKRVIHPIIKVALGGAESIACLRWGARHRLRQRHFLRLKRRNWTDAMTREDIEKLSGVATEELGRFRQLDSATQEAILDAMAGPLDNPRLSARDRAIAAARSRLIGM